MTVTIIPYYDLYVDLLTCTRSNYGIHVYHNFLPLRLFGNPLQLFRNRLVERLHGARILVMSIRVTMLFLRTSVIEAVSEQLSPEDESYLSIYKTQYWQFAKTTYRMKCVFWSQRETTITLVYDILTDDGCCPLDQPRIYFGVTS